MGKYSIPVEITTERGLGYIRLFREKSQQKLPVKTIRVHDPYGTEIGIYIDIDQEGRIYGIEVMDDKLLPPEYVGRTCTKEGCIEPSVAKVMGSLTYYPCERHREEIERLVDGE